MLHKELEFSLGFVAYHLCVCSEVEFWGCAVMLVEKNCLLFKTGLFKGFFSRVIMPLICVVPWSAREKGQSLGQTEWEGKSDHLPLPWEFRMVLWGHKEESGDNGDIPSHKELPTLEMVTAALLSAP